MEVHAHTRAINNTPHIYATLLLLRCRGETVGGLLLLGHWGVLFARVFEGFFFPCRWSLDWIEI